MGADFWARHVAAARGESVSMGAYARQHGLAVSTLYYWQRKLREMAAPLPSRPSASFVEVRVADSPLSTTGSCTLMLGSGVRLSLPCLPAPEWLAALVRATESC